MQAKLRIASLTAALALGVAVPTSADWNFGDPHKMHYPQLPELHEGIDVNASFPKILADDWLCTQSGPVSDIHIWGSWDYDYKYPGAWIHASIHEYLPPDPQIPYSRPGVVLWQHDFRPGEYTQRPWVDPEGPPPYPQFFWDPKQPFQPVVNHFEIWQYNIEDISNAFYQLAGTYYFLDISFFAGYDAAGNPIPLPPGFQFGWKTSRSPQFNDDAVWGHYGPGPYPPPWWLPGYLKPDWPNPPDWNELRDPRFQFQRSLDLAFVITPEPTTLALIGLGLVVALRRR
jgi:hypothetical protein